MMIGDDGRGWLWGMMVRDATDDCFDDAYSLITWVKKGLMKKAGDRG